MTAPACSDAEKHRNFMAGIDRLRKAGYDISPQEAELLFLGAVFGIGGPLPDRREPPLNPT